MTPQNANRNKKQPTKKTRSEAQQKAAEGKGIPCLSLLQPWASLVVSGAKTIETRSWQTPYRGPLLIHASSGKKGKALAGDAPFARYVSDFDRLPFGAVIGQVQLEDVVPVELLFYSATQLAVLTLEEKAFGDYTKGRYAWLLSAPVAFDQPIPAKGRLGLWWFSAPGNV